MLQSIQGEVTKRQPILSAVRDIVAQLGDMAEEGSISEAENNIKQLNQQITELSDNLQERRVNLRVSDNNTMSVSII